MALAGVGRYHEALEHLLEVTRNLPREPRPLKEAAWILATCPDPKLRSPQEAVALAQRANELNPNPDTATLDVLAAAHAAAGDFDQAKSVAQEALEVAGEDQDNELILQIRQRLDLYEQERPFVEQQKADREPGG